MDTTDLRAGLTHWGSSFLGLAALTLAVPGRSAAQATRDSAGIQIVTSDRPLWNERQALRLAPAPSLTIGTGTGDTPLFNRVTDLLELSDGTIVVADGGDLNVRFFAPDGRHLRSSGRSGDGPGEFRRIDALFRLPGDTVAVGAPRALTLFTADGQPAGIIPGPRQSRPPWGMPMAVFAGHRRVLITPTMPEPRAAGSRWVQLFPASLVDSANGVLRDLGAFQGMPLAMEDHARQIWFAPTAAMTSDSAGFYFGFPAEYSITRYDTEGRLTRIIRRRWTPVAVTAADRSDYVREWGKNWIRSTGAEAEAEYADLRDDPYWETVPAFSQLIVDGTGRLWVREAHLPDAANNGELYTMPLVASRWSVFGTDGRWLCDVTMPARFHPKAIGKDHVIGIAVDADGVRTVVRYEVLGGGQ